MVRQHDSCIYMQQRKALAFQQELSSIITLHTIHRLSCIHNVWVFQILMRPPFLRCQIGCLSHQSNAQCQDIFMKHAYGMLAGVHSDGSPKRTRGRMHVIPTRRSFELQWRFPYGLICSQMPPSIAKLPVSPGELHAEHTCIRQW